jgi:uncharacterized delta-60 repeat protein
MYKVLGFSVFLLLGSQEIMAQNEEWVARFNGQENKNDEASDIAVDPSGNIYVTGWSEGSGFSNDFSTLKYNSSGDTLWVRLYNGTGNFEDRATAITLDASGHVYVTGWSFGNGTSNDFVTIKYDSLGDTLWVRRYNGPGDGPDNPYALTVDPTGNVYVTGFSWSGTSDDYATIKYDSQGNTQWVSRYSGFGNRVDCASAIALDPSGNVYVTGWSRGEGSYNDYATIKYNSNGDSVWVRRFNGPGNFNDMAYALAVDPLGNVYVSGQISNGIGEDSDYATIKYSSSGDSLWVMKYDGPGNGEDGATDLILDSAGYIYVTGRSTGIGTALDFATIKYDSSGDTIWVRRYNRMGATSDRASAIALGPLGKVYVTGGSFLGFFNPYDDYATICYNSDGDLEWERIYDGPGNYYDMAKALAVDLSGNVYVTGRSDGDSSSLDFATIKYSLNVGAEEEVSDIGLRNAEFRLLQNQPNPVSDFTAISYQLRAHSYVSIRIYDITGRLVNVLVDAPQEAGFYQLPITNDQLPGSGIYFYRLQASDFRATKKLVVLK